MDTRPKILDSYSGDADVIEGYFDPLLATHAEQLSAIKNSRPLVVVIRDPEEPLLPARARAELVAGLRCVDAVLIGGPLKGRWIAENREALMQVIREKHGR